MSYENFLAKTTLFTNLTSQQLEAISALAKLCSYKKGATIFTEGAIAKNFFIIITGQVKVFKLSPAGKTQIIKIFQAGESFAEAAMFENATYPVHAEAITAAKILSFSRDEFLNLIARDPKIALNILALFSIRLKELTTTIENLTLKESPNRFAVYLLHCSALNNNATTFNLSISRILLAELLGTSRETLSRVISKMVQDKLIDLKNNKITIINQKQIKILAQTKPN